MDTPQIIAITISVISLSLSIITFYRQRKRLTVTFSDNVFVLNPRTSILLNGEPLPYDSPVAFYATINIVNPSHENMSFFDLRAFNPSTNANHFIATQRTSLANVNEPNVVIDCFEDGQTIFLATLPKRAFGELPAGSFTSLDVIVFANSAISLKEGITISFSVPDTILFPSKNEYSVTNRKVYKQFSRHYDVTGWEDTPSFRQ